MITANFTGDALTVRGHAGYAPPGQDIVCAAVSTVVVLCEAALDAFDCAWHETDDGQTLTVTARGPAAQTVLGVALKTLRRIAAQYPAHVAVFSGAEGAAAAPPDLVRCKRKERPTTP